MKLETFFENNKKDLILIFENEKKLQGEGILYVDLTDKEKGNVVFLPINSEYLTDDVKKSIEERKPHISNSTIFIFSAELDNDNNSIINRIEWDLESN
jgi:hypothetical protein